jgi:hypothetical protein
MRTPNYFNLIGALLLAFVAACFLYATFSDGGDSGRGVLFFGSTLFPSFMGLALIVIGFATGLFSRSASDRHEIA